jgi:asparagine synthase (glutamine-hydrolysing)
MRARFASPSLGRRQRANRSARGAPQGSGRLGVVTPAPPGYGESRVCGICGVVQLRGEPRPVVAPEVLDRMTDAMTHRGPDDRGTYAADGVALGVRRLSIVDVDGGHQPLANEDGRIWAVQNGELFNHSAVRADLEASGHELRSRCDTEVIPHLYEDFGTAFAERLRGMFGIALWDDRERRLVVVRDRLGIKPMYYAVVGDLLVFASELKSLLASGIVPLDLDYEAIDAFLSLGFVPAPMTPLAAVRKLLPGHRIVVDPTGVSVEQWWRYPEPAPVEASLEECAERLLAELSESVRLRLMSDVPLGAMLSGGIDSSIVVALMAREMAEPVKTFSIGFAEAGEGNELADARLVAGAFGTDHHELELSFAEQTVDLSELVWYMDEPLADLSSLGFLALSELARTKVTVALSGQGADELLGGYRKHRAAAITGAWQRLPGPVRGVGEHLLAKGPQRIRRASRTLQATDPATRLLEMSGNLRPGLRATLARGPLAELDGLAGLRAVRSRLGDVVADPLPATLYLDGQLGLVDDMLHYFDRASMAHSLEVRVPFLDHHVVEYCATIPARHKVHRLRTTKHVLKHLARGLIPDRIIDKPKVGFFNAAVDGWFRAQTRGAISDYLLGPSPRYAEILDRREVERLAARHADGSDTRNAYALLSILMLEVWLSSYLPRASAAERWAPERDRVAIR